MEDKFEIFIYIRTPIMHVLKQTSIEPEPHLIWKRSAAPVVIYYLLSLFIILPTFCGIIHIYINRITECEFLENEFSKVPINWQNQIVIK